MGSESVVKVIIGGLAALGGLAIGALARQPEVSKLKKQVTILKKDLSERMYKVEEELNRQLDELNKRYLALRAWQFFEKRKTRIIYEKKADEVYFMKCCCSEFIRLLGKSVAKKEKLLESEQTFLSSFTNVLENKSTEQEVDFIKRYILDLKFDKEFIFDFQEQIERDIVA